MNRKETRGRSFMSVLAGLLGTNTKAAANKDVRYYALLEQARAAAEQAKMAAPSTGLEVTDSVQSEQWVKFTGCDLPYGHDLKEQARQGCGNCFYQDCDYPNCLVKPADHNIKGGA